MQGPGGQVPQAVTRNHNGPSPGHPRSRRAPPPATSLPYTVLPRAPLASSSSAPTVFPCSGKWARATAAEVEAAKAQGLPYCYRFRVPSVSGRPADTGARGREG